MNTNYKIITDHNLLVQKYKGEFCFDDLFEHIKNVTKDPNWSKVEKIITDLRNIDLEVFYKNMDYFLKYRNNNVMKSYFNVFLVNTPLSTALVHLYKEQLNSNKYKYEYCSTVEYAITFLGLQDQFEEIKSIMEKL